MFVNKKTKKNIYLISYWISEWKNLYTTYFLGDFFQADLMVKYFHSESCWKEEKTDNYFKGMEAKWQRRNDFTKKTKEQWMNNLWHALAKVHESFQMLINKSKNRSIEQLKIGDRKFDQQAREYESSCLIRYLIWSHP